MRKEAITRSMANEMLSKARRGLPKSREIMLFPILTLVYAGGVLNDTEKKRLINMFVVGYKQEGLLTENLIVPAKKALGMSVTVQEVEEQAKKHAGDFTNKLGFDREVGEKLVLFNIEHTKSIQRKMGVKNTRCPRTVFTRASHRVKT